MAVRQVKAKTKIKKAVVEEMAMPVVEPVKEEKKKVEDDVFGEKLDPAEEKMLDRILMAVVVFILAWLGLSVLLVLRGYACSEWIKGSFMCAGL